MMTLGKYFTALLSKWKLSRSLEQKKKEHLPRCVGNVEDPTIPVLWRSRLAKSHFSRTHTKKTVQRIQRKLSQDPLAVSADFHVQPGFCQIETVCQWEASEPSKENNQLFFMISSYWLWWSWIRTSVGPWYQYWSWWILVFKSSPGLDVKTSTWFGLFSGGGDYWNLSIWMATLIDYIFIPMDLWTMGLVRITSWYPNFNGSHFGLPPSEIHRMTGLPPKIVWTMTCSHRPHCTSWIDMIATDPEVSKWDQSRWPSTGFHRHCVMQCATRLHRHGQRCKAAQSNLFRSSVRHVARVLERGVTFCGGLGELPQKNLKFKVANTPKFNDFLQLLPTKFWMSKYLLLMSSWRKLKVARPSSNPT